MPHQQISARHHSPTCTGCPICNDELRSLLSMTPEERCAWVTGPQGEHERRLRAADYTPPDPYADGIAKMRSDLPPTATLDRRDDDATPPNPYEAGIARLRRELPSLPLTPVPKNYASPDPYASALETMRREIRR